MKWNRISREVIEGTAKTAVLHAVNREFACHGPYSLGMRFAYKSIVMTPSVQSSQPNAHFGDRLNLLITCGSWRKDTTVRQLPRLLEPIGIRTLHAENGEDALNMISKHDIHIAIVDLAIPLTSSTSNKRPSGERVLQLLRRLQPHPPTIVMRPRQASARESARSLVRSLHEGAFTVVDRPAVIETLLDALHRALKRHYADRWPLAK